MECNKEEALRAKDIAEKKMLNDDFVGARRIVLKAQKLFPDLDNISQMLTVCEVHCSAAVKINGVTDWYSILQVEPTVDELTIKKQYRKLALLLHPDKNKFGGAEAAFKLVVEGHKTLTDRAKRSVHDRVRGSSFRPFSARQPTQHQQLNRTTFTRKQAAVANGNGLNLQQQSTSQTFWTICPSCGIRYQYFTSIMNRALRCQSCKKPFVAYDLNASTAPSAAPWNRAGFTQIGNQVPPGHFASGLKTNFGTGSNIGGVGEGSTVPEPSPTSGMTAEFHGGSNDNAKDDFKVDKSGEQDDEVKFKKVNLPEVSKNEQAAKGSAGNRGQKRGRKAKLGSTNSRGIYNDVNDDGYASKQNAGSGGSHPRRSTRQKANISYNDDRSDNFECPKQKKTRVGMSSIAGEFDVETPGEGANWKNGQASDAAPSIGKVGSKNNFGSSSNGWHESKEKAGPYTGAGSMANDGVDLSSEASQEPVSLSYPDPEFWDFEKGRNETNFESGQVWAVYDNSDAMPRFYALIRQVYGPKFRLRFNWLEYDPTSKAETLYFKGGLPVGCGSFKLGKSEYTQERLMFSHLMPWRKGTKRNLYDIIPCKGEIWALFKNWDMEWPVDRNRAYEYEIVEVIADFTDGVISVVRLVRVQDFVCIFVQDTDGSSPIRIEMKDMLKFSHRVPSYRLTGNEREGVPKGSLELDCASLPCNFREMLPSISLTSAKPKTEDLGTTCNSLHSEKQENKGDSTWKTNNSSCKTEKTSVAEVQRSTDTCKESDSFKMEVSHSSTAKHTAVEPQNTVEIDNTKPKQQDVSEKKGNSATASTIPSSSPNCFEYPDPEFHSFEEERLPEKFETGQIWALFSDINKYPNYYGRIGKVSVDSSSFKVHVTWMEGYTDEEHEKLWLSNELPFGCGAFKAGRETFVCDSPDTFSHMISAIPGPRKRHCIIYPSVGEIWAIYKNWTLNWSIYDLEDCEFEVVEIVSVIYSGFQVSVLTKEPGYRSVFRSQGKKAGAVVSIPFRDRLKFSHQIPAFRLTEERGGKLRGCWELDPAATPDVLLFVG